MMHVHRGAPELQPNDSPPDVWESATLCSPGGVVNSQHISKAPAEVDAEVHDLWWEQQYQSRWR